MQRPVAFLAVRGFLTKDTKSILECADNNTTRIFDMRMAHPQPFKVAQGVAGRNDL
jgi:hypothetical protein